MFQTFVNTEKGVGSSDNFKATLQSMQFTSLTKCQRVHISRGIQCFNGDSCIPLCQSYSDSNNYPDISCYRNTVFFLHDLSWMSLWINSIYSKLSLDIIFQVPEFQWLGLRLLCAINFDVTGRKCSDTRRRYANNIIFCKTKLISSNINLYISFHVQTFFHTLTHG